MASTRPSVGVRCATLLPPRSPVHAAAGRMQAVLGMGTAEPGTCLCGTDTDSLRLFGLSWVWATRLIN